MKKPNIIKVRLGLKIALIAILLVAGILSLRGGYQKAMHYRDIKETAVQVVSTIVYVEENEDSDGDTYYKAHVTYSYNGNKYSQTVDGSRKSRVGDTVTFSINPNDPMEIIYKTRTAYKFAIGIGSLLLGLACATARMQIREGWCVTYGINREMIHQDLLNKAKRDQNGIGGLIVAIGATIGWLVNRTDFILMIEAVIFAVAGICLLKSFVAVMRLVAGQEYTVQRDRLISKRIEEDSDGADTHYLQYKTSNEISYEITVTQKVYNRAVEGDEILSVFLPQQKKPYMNIHLHDRTMQ